MYTALSMYTANLSEKAIFARHSASDVTTFPFPPLIPEEETGPAVQPPIEIGPRFYFTLINMQID